MSLSDFDFYISNAGRLIIPSLSIDYLVNMTESSLPNMPEASENSVRIAGRDGDIPLSTTYEPISMNIICYTEMGLTQIQKTAEERKINKFLNSIKNSTKTFVLEKDSKYYIVKYNGVLTTINYPTHLEFSIPLKSSFPFGYTLNKSTITGNGSLTSDTIEETGAVFTIEGPAINPIITLNDYSMEYSNSLLTGDKLIIDTNKSTVTHINSQQTKTNAMMYYNHQFPKIQNGTNTLAVLSGIEDNTKVKVEWNDLIL